MRLDRAVIFAAAASVVSVRAEALPKAKDVTVRVWVQGSGTSFRHRVYVTNKSGTRQIETVAIGLAPGLREEPRLTSGPAGWSTRIIKQAQGVWAVEFGCSSRTMFRDQGGTSSTTPARGPCGIVAGQTLSFDVVLAYNSPSLGVGPIGVIYSDGQQALAVP